MPRPTRSLLRRPHLTWRLTHPCAAYTDLEVWDTAELKQLESRMLEMEKSLSALRAKAVAENRPVRTHAPLPTCTVARRGAWRVNCGTASHGVAWRGAWLPARAWRGRLVECAHPAARPGWAPACGHPVHAHAPQLTKKKAAPEISLHPLYLLISPCISAGDQEELHLRHQ